MGNYDEDNALYSEDVYAWVHCTVAANGIHTGNLNFHATVFSINAIFWISLLWSPFTSENTILNELSFTLEKGPGLKYSNNLLLNE